MTSQPDFNITASGKISKQFIDKNILTYAHAADFIMHLPYGRNADKNNLGSLFIDNCGTCSTKHALLKQLADENNFKGIQLILGIFKMNAKNTPEIAATLKTHKLDYIPEAHNYLKFKNQIFDYTKPGFKLTGFVDDFIKEIEIAPHQITDFKVAYHKKYLSDWLYNNKINLTAEELWGIREQCILDLSIVMGEVNKKKL